MGAFYTNILLRGPAQERVVRALKALRRDAFVSGPEYLHPGKKDKLPPVSMKDVVVVYDWECESQDVAVSDSLCRKLTSRLRCSGLTGLGVDDDLLLCSLFKGGRLLGRYMWTQGSFDEQAQIRTMPAAAFAKRLCNAFGLPEAAPGVTKVLSASEDPRGPSGVVLHGGAGWLHGDLVQALFEGLGIGQQACSLVCDIGYTYLVSRPDDFPVWGETFAKIQAARAKRRRRFPKGL